MQEVSPHNLPAMPEPLPVQPVWFASEHEPIGQGLVRTNEHATHAHFTEAALTAYEDYLNLDNEGTSEDELTTSVNGLLMHTRGEKLTDKELGDMGGIRRAASELNEDIQERKQEFRDTATENAKTQHEQLQQTRADIKGMDKTPRGKLLANEYFEAVEKPKLFKEWREMDADITGSEKKPWMDWLVEDATDDQLLNVMQWHNDRIKKYNTDPQIQAEVESRRAEYIKGWQALVEQGYVHPDTAFKINRVKTADIYAADPLKLHFDRIRGEAFPKGNYVVLLPEVMTNTEHKTFEHELSHLLFTVSEQWAEEVGCDYFAGAIRSGSPEADDALINAVTDPSGYMRADLKFLGIIAGDEQATRAFARYLTAPIDQKVEARHAFCTALSKDQDPDSVWTALSVIMTRHLKQGMGEVDYKEDLSAQS